MSVTDTAADNTVSHRRSAGPPHAGAELEIDSLDYAGIERLHRRQVE